MSSVVHKMASYLKMENSLQRRDIIYHGMYYTFKKKTSKFKGLHPLKLLFAINQLKSD